MAHVYLEENSIILEETLAGLEEWANRGHISVFGVENIIQNGNLSFGKMKYPSDYINKIIQGDCLEVMKDMPDECVDLILVDPPFGKGKDFANDKLDDFSLYEFLRECAEKYWHILKYNLLVETPKDKLPLFLDIFSLFSYEYPIILHLTNDMRNGKIGYSSFSLVLWFSKKRRSINRYKDMLVASFDNTLKEFSHPSPKNITHYCQLLRMFSNENDIVLDSFLGSGTTAIACKEMKRRYIGIELNPEYIKIAEERLSQEVFDFND